MSERIIRSDQPLHLLLGPLFIAVAEAIALGKGASVPIFLLWLAPIGLLLTSLWRLRGAFISSALLLTFPALQGFSLFSFTWGLSVSLALLVSALLLDEDAPLESFIREEEPDAKEENFQDFQEEKERMEQLVAASDEEARKHFFQAHELEKKLQTLMSERAKVSERDGAYHLLEDKEQEIERLRGDVASLEHELALQSQPRHEESKSTILD